MTETAMRVSHCRVCDANDWVTVVSYGLMPLANAYLDPAPSYSGERRYPLNLIACRNCWLVSLGHVVDPEVLYRDYFYVSSDSATMMRHMKRIADTCIQRFEVPACSLVVELGSNIGTQLQFFGAAGMRVLGVDPARNLAQEASGNGIPTIPEFFSIELARQIYKEQGPAHLLIGRHVFAHVDDLAEIISGARSLLDSESGIFAIEVPYLMDMLAGKQFDTIYHEHLSYFSVGTLSRLFERHGMRIIDIERFPVHGGSIMVAAAPHEARWPVRPSVPSLLEKEDQEGLSSERRYREFAEATLGVQSSLATLVRRIASEGKRIVGYGAPAKSSVLLGACGLGAGEIAYCTDTTLLKQGKVLPGTHIPIFPPAHADLHPPDYYLLFAWNYAEEILQKERAYLASGGRIIVPLPEPSVVGG
jgi:C-methyltransferase-like protein/putative zinc binding protein/methyltransferase family protein